MAETQADVKRWRNRAKELRALAETFSHDASKQSLQQVADTYDKLADHSETMLAKKANGADQVLGVLLP